MDKLLHLGVPRETDFWSSPVTLESLRIVDTLGLLLGLSINSLVALTCFKKGLSMFSQCAQCVVLQLLQLTWLRWRTRSYMQHRSLITILQRSRWLYHTMRQYTALSEHIYIISSKFDAQSAPTTATFLCVLCMQPCSALLSSLFHPLPFRQHATMCVITLAFYYELVLPLQLRALEQYQLQAWVPPACSSLMAVHAPMLPTIPGMCHLVQDVCSSGQGAPLLLAYTFLLTAIIIPLCLLYWHEHAAKVAWLQARGVQGAAHVDCVMWLLYAWGCCAMAFALLLVYHTASMQWGG